MDRKIQIIEYKNFAANETISDGAVYSFIRQYAQASLVNRGNSGFIIFFVSPSFFFIQFQIFSHSLVTASRRYNLAHKVRNTGYFD